VQESADRPGGGLRTKVGAVVLHGNETSPARWGKSVVIQFQAFQELFQEHQEFQGFQETATHFKSVSRDIKRQQEFQEFQEHVSRVLDTI